MGVYDLHRLLYEVHSKPAVKEAYLADPEEVFQRYTLTEEELAALRKKDFYRLLKLGGNAYLLAPFARLLGYTLTEFGQLLRAGAETERQQRSGEVT